MRNSKCKYSKFDFNAVVCLTFIINEDTKNCRVLFSICSKSSGMGSLQPCPFPISLAREFVFYFSFSPLFYIIKLINLSDKVLSFCNFIQFFFKYLTFKKYII